MKMFKVCEANSQNVNFGGSTGTGTPFANAVNSANTMQSGDGVYDFTLTEAYDVQREHAQNGIATTIVKDERSPGGYIVTQSQEAHVLPSGLEKRNLTEAEKVAFNVAGATTAATIGGVACWRIPTCANYVTGSYATAATALFEYGVQGQMATGAATSYLTNAYYRTSNWLLAHPERVERLNSAVVNAAEAVGSYLIPGPPDQSKAGWFGYISGVLKDTAEGKSLINDYLNSFKPYVDNSNNKSGK